MQYQLVIFDNDGVLVDSEPISNRVLAAYLTELGHPTSYDEAVRDYMGAAVHRIHDLVGARLGQTLPPEFDEELHRRVFDAFRRELEPVAGVGAVLETLATGGVRYCLASSSSHERIRVALTKTGLAGRFSDQSIFSAQDVARGKPAPDLFLHASRQMGAEPAACAVIEDSPLGVQAAVAAGMDAFGYAAMTPAASLKGAVAVFNRMADLPALLASRT